VPKPKDFAFRGTLSRRQTPTLIKTRDTLIHDGRVKDIDFVHRETARLRAVVERALLSLLGWKDFSRTPPKFRSAWLESKL
jgi:hypothetical protein